MNKTLEKRGIFILPGSEELRREAEPMSWMIFLMQNAEFWWIDVNLDESFCCRWKENEGFVKGCDGFGGGWNFGV